MIKFVAGALVGAGALAAYLAVEIYTTYSTGRFE